MKELVKKGFDLLGSSQNLLLLTHEKPDGDAIGSIISFKLVLDKMEKNSTALCSSPIPQIYHFLPQVVKQSKKLPSTDLIVVLDTANLELLGKIYQKNRRSFSTFPILNIDHHPDNTHFGKVNIILPQASSTGEILADLYQKWQFIIEKEIANSLITSIVSETLFFQLQNLSAHTMEVVASLMRKGGELYFVSQGIHKSKNRAVYNLWGEVLLKTKEAFGGEVVWSYVSQAMLKRHGIKMEEANLDGLVNTMSTLKGSLITLLAKEERPQKIRFSLRSDISFDARSIAESFGGGGHHTSAACTLNQGLKKAINTVLSRIKAKLEK